MSFKKKVFIIILIVTIFLGISSIVYKYSISPDIEITVSNDILLKTRFNQNFSEFKDSINNFFKDTFKNSKIKPYRTDDKNSFIEKKYILRNIKLFTTKLDDFPVSAKIIYDYNKNILYKNKSNKIYNPNKKLYLLYNSKDKIWVNTKFNLWFVPFVFIVTLLILILIYNFIIKPKLKKLNEKIKVSREIS